MPALCPKCRTPLQLEQIPLRKDVHLICASCQAALTVSLVVTLDSGGSAGEPVSPRLSSSALNEKKVVSLVEGEASNEMIREVMTEGGFELRSGSGGQDIMELLERERPGIIIVDVGFSDVLGFEIANMIKQRNDLKDIGVILLASIHDKTRYKREPESLYGADDYIERHHIQDQLLPKMNRILEARKRPVSAGGAAGPSAAGPVEPRPSSSMETASAVPSQKAKAAEQAMSIEHVFESMVEEERRPLSVKSPSQDFEKTQAVPRMVGDPAAHEAAKRLARIIMSDIALYNQRAVEEGVRNGTIYELLRDEIEEGKKLYDGRVPHEIVSSTDYYRQAIDEFVKKRKMEMQKRA
jgi:DNA-binding response OmpR family regulator